MKKIKKNNKSEGGKILEKNNRKFLFRFELPEEIFEELYRKFHIR